MARVRRNWTPKEDELLRCAVRTAEAQQRPLLWRELAKAVPGRSNKDCRRRWWNSLAEGNAKGPWAEEEDERLIVAVQKYGTNWTRVAQEVGSRGSDQCSSHWSHVLDPNINYCDWTEEEDADLLHEVLTYGTKWAHISTCHKPLRTSLCLKNRYSTLRLKINNKNRSRQDSVDDKFLNNDSINNNDDNGANMTIIAAGLPENWRRNDALSSAETGEPARKHEDDEQDEEGDKDGERLIDTWLDHSHHTNRDRDTGASNNHQHFHHHHRPQSHLDETTADSIRVSVPMHVQMQDCDPLASWDAWAKLGLLAPHHQQQHQNGAQGSIPSIESLGVEKYLQLETAPMLFENHSDTQTRPPHAPYPHRHQHQPTQEPSPLSDSSFIPGEESRALGQITPGSHLYPSETRHPSPMATSSPTTTSAQMQPAPTERQPSSSNGALSSVIPSRSDSIATSSMSTIAGGMMGSLLDSGAGPGPGHCWGLGAGSGIGSNTTSCSDSSPPPSAWPSSSGGPQQQCQQPSPVPSLTSLGPAGRFRVTISTVCDQDQLMAIVSQMGQYGCVPSINIAQD